MYTCTWLHCRFFAYVVFINSINEMFLTILFAADRTSDTVKFDLGSIAVNILLGFLYGIYGRTIAQCF